MKIIISPAKKMHVDLECPGQIATPNFLSETRELLSLLQSMDGQALQKLWKCNDSIAQLNIQRLADMRLDKWLTPALFSYEGIQYQYLAPNVLETSQLDYLQAHLRIVSGFYGLLRPFDGVTPYRLEMQSRLAVGAHKNLYHFWGAKLAKQLAQEGTWILNLASKEYSQAIQPHLPPELPFVTCTFGELKEGKLLEKGTMCKMARGQMTRWLAEQQVTSPEQLKDFNQLDYQFSQVHSTEHQLVFLKKVIQSL